MDKNDVIVREIERLKNSEFKATAIKVEFEAQLGRQDERDDECSWCDEGEVECSECSGAGNRYCHNCDGSGTVEVDELEQECDVCEGQGEYECEDCEGSGLYTCGECDGNWEGGSGDDFGSTNYCHDYLLGKLVDLGLARATVDGDDHYPYASEYRPTGALIFSKFYFDGSVDSEWTLTLSLENPETVLLLPKLVETFVDLGNAVGNGIGVSGAGMHMALLNSTDCRYPVGASSEDIRRFDNFQKSMGLLLPALYFLASSNEKSRGLNYRRPQIGFDTHRSAIDYRGGAVEFRVFDTCYDNPENILDNVVVMAKAMKFWTLKYTKNNLSKITSQTQFGVDNSDKLDRLYQTTTHIDLLNGGLNILKPDYYTIRQLKEQRQFKTNKRTINGQINRIRKEASTSYKEYINRCDWIQRERLLQETRRLILNFIDTPESMAVNIEAKIKEFEAMADSKVKSLDIRLAPDSYVAEEIRKFTTRNIGDYTLTA